MTERPPVILFVPGIRAKPPPEQQQEQLRRCLEAALLRQGIARANDLASQLHVVGWSYAFYGAHDSIAPDMPAIEQLVSGAGDPAGDREEAEGIGSRLVAVMYAIGDRFPVLSSLFATRRMEARMQEINRYFRNRDDHRTTICELLKQSLREAWADEREIILIGHSFGSVIAYDTLWELTHEEPEGSAQKVDLFISMGSPLTMNYVRRRLHGAARRGHERYPCNIRHWLNLAAIGEVTALDRRMAQCFGEMLSLGVVESIRDNLGVLARYRNEEGLNVHKCYGYMASDTVAEVIASAAARFSPEA
ncbi:MAG: hypothetical protein KJP03_02190 [Gammaproteobacteria bacterium]|nr:hypothetical protein [Gammaproteobacteria bacterium]